MKPPKMSLSETARRLEISRQALAAHRKRPGAPKLGDIEGWKLFLAAVGREGTAPAQLRRQIAEKKLELLSSEIADRELARQERRGDLVSMGEVEKLLLEKVVHPLRARLLSALTTLDALCNPSDPELARQAVQHWVDETLKLLREKLDEG